jgi:hypothetical protein
MPEPTAEAKDKGVIGLGVVITLVSLIGAFALGDYAVNNVVADKVTSDPFANYKDQAATTGESGQSTEGVAGSPQKISIEDLNVFQVVLELSWTDEPDTARHTNQPDTFALEVTSPDGRTSQGSGSNVPGAPGSIVVTMERPIGKEVLDNKALKKKTSDPTWSGDWSINVSCTSAGDQTFSIGPDITHLLDQADTGNAWELAVTWTFKTK